MTYYDAQATGNWDTAATWGTLVVGADTHTASLTVTTTQTAATTTNTPGAINVDAVLLHLGALTGATGTITVGLNTGGGTSIVAGTSVTINVSDLPSAASTSDEGGWIKFVFAAPVLLTAATAYSATVKTGSAAQVNLYGASGTNWDYLIRQSGTTNTPGASDLVIITKEWTAAATGTARTVTVEHTSATAILKAAGSCGAINICQGGKLQYPTTTATTLQLVVGDGTTAASDVRVYSGGTLDMNTQSDVTTICKLLLNVTAVQADALSGFIFKNGSTVTGTGFTRTRKTTLTADAAANATTFTVADVTGWQVGDTLAIAPTTRTATQGETVTIASISSLTVTIATGGGSGGNSLLNAHGGGGTALVVAEVINITSNIVLGSNQSTLASTGSGYIDIKPSAAVTLSQVEFRYLGGTTSGNGTSTNGNRGIEIETTTAGSCSLTNCTLHDFRNWGLVFNTGSGSVTTSIVAYNLNTAAAAATNGVVLGPTTGAHTVSGTFIGLITPSSGTAFMISDIGSSITNLTVAGSGVGSGSNAVQTNESFNPGTFNSWNIHSNAGVGVAIFAGDFTGTIGSAGSPCYGWRNTSEAIQITGTPARCVIDSWTLFGNGSQNVNQKAGGLLWLKSCTLRSDATLATATGLNFAAGSTGRCILTNCDFGSGTAHTQDINVAAIGGADLTAWGTSFHSASGIPVISSTANASGTIIRSHNDGGVAGAHKVYSRFGAVTTDASHLDTGQTIGWKVTTTANAGATRPMVLPGPSTFDTNRVDVPASLPGTVSLAVRVYLSASGGTGVTLHVVGGPLGGVGSWGTDSTAATTTTGSYQTLTVSGLTPTEAGTLEWFLASDNSASVYWLGDVTVTGIPTVDTTTLQIPERGLPASHYYKVTASGIMRASGFAGGLLG